MKCNWRRWLWGIVPLLVLSWAAVQSEHARLEADLAQRARQALDSRGHVWAAVEFEGRDAVLTGRAPQEGEPAKAAALLAGVRGVRVVDNRAGLLEKSDKYLWVAQRRSNRIKFGGYAPSYQARQAILGVARVSFPGFEVVDHTVLARGAPSYDVWLAGVSFALKQLALIKRGEVRLDGLDLTVAGEAEDAGAYRAVKSALANNAPKGIKVTADLVTAPVVSPFTWLAQLGNGRLVLTGYVPDETARAELLAAAKASLPDIDLDDKMEPGHGAPQGWAGVAAAAIRELARLRRPGGASIKDAVLAVFGTAADEAVAESVRNNLRAALPAAFKFVDQIQALPLPLPRAPAKQPPAVPGTTGSASAPAKEASAPPAAPPPGPPAPAPVKETSAPPAGTGGAPVPSQEAPVPPAAAGSAGPAAAPAREASAAEVQAKACQAQLRNVAAAGPVLFALASAEIARHAYPTLDRLAEAANACPGMRIEVAGHASREGSAEFNQDLSLRRAQSVVAYLVQAGVEAERLEPVGYGASRPLAQDDSEEGRAGDRRIEFTVRPR